MSRQTPPSAHVVPCNDLIDHEGVEDCVCGPEVEPVRRKDGSVGWLIVHHSLDGREYGRFDEEEGEG
jgi:hypothetical protein